MNSKLTQKLMDLKSYICALLIDESSSLYPVEEQMLGGLLQLIDVVLLDEIDGCYQLSQRSYVEGVTLHVREIFKSEKDRTYLNKIASMLEDIIESCEAV